MRIYFYCLTLFVVSCRSINPEAPISSSTPMVVIPEQTISAINIPISIDLTPYFKETDAAIPKTFNGNEETCEGVSVAYHFIRGPIKFNGTGTNLNFNVDGNYSVKLNYCPQCTGLFSDAGNCIVPRVYTSCGISEAMPGIHIGFNTKIGVTPNYELKSKTTLETVKATSPCKVTIFNYDATSHVEEEVRKALKSVEKDIDKEISAISLKSDMQTTWDLLSEAIDLEGYGYFLMNPVSVGITDIQYKGNFAYFNARLDTKPMIVLERPELKHSVIPNLSSVSMNEGFALSMDVMANYDSLSKIISREIGSTEIAIKRKSIIVDSIFLSPFNSQLSVRVNFSGDKHGMLYLTGTPVLDSMTQQLVIPDLEFDVKTKSVLLKSAKWLFDKKITEMIRSYAIIDLKPYLDDLKKEINLSLNGELTKGVLMTGEINSAQIQQIIPLTEHLLIRGKGIGKIAISM